MEEEEVPVRSRTTGFPGSTSIGTAEGEGEGYDV